jgi:hypothetical protein
MYIKTDRLNSWGRRGNDGALAETCRTKLVNLKV